MARKVQIIKARFKRLILLGLMLDPNILFITNVVF